MLVEEEVVTEYLVRTQGQWDWLMEYLEETTDLKWGSEAPPTHHDYWKGYKEDTKVFARDFLSYGNSTYWTSTSAVEVEDLMDEVETEFRERKHPSKTPSHTLTSELKEQMGKLFMEEEDVKYVYVYCYGEVENELEVFGFKADGFGLYEDKDMFYVYDEDGLLGTFSVEQVARIWKQVGKVEEEYGEE